MRPGVRSPNSWNKEKRDKARKQLLKAVRQNDLRQVQTFLQQGFARHLSILEELLEMAVACRYDGVSELLLEAGARSWPAMAVAVGGNNTDAVNRILKHWIRPPLSRSLTWAIKAGSLEAAKLLLERGVKRKDAALLSAARGGRVEFVKLLLLYGAHPKGDHFRACIEGLGHCESMFRLLLSTGAELGNALGQHPAGPLPVGTLEEIRREVALCRIVAALGAEDRNHAAAKKWMGYISREVNGYGPMAPDGNPEEASRFNEALAQLNREIVQCAELYGLAHTPNPGATALML